ncbi:trimeric intracellular cation channel family protein [Neptunitalea lumnitzerae]|uniref:Membrane protein n=1 Tax=Neptunitalea lumnitzerae TaxID=2965509 RepID=A0ABQ5MLP5_9FLAO|nr:trimeric intracellular cation channel family protein [Neptunitalea sp. Y10]GLB50304.1 membrane protein [Neptunitalea sp. Y10]
MILEIIDILGVVSFTISGVLVALRKKLDAFGVLIIGFVTATGGGTLRDLLLGVRPIWWLIDTRVVYTIIITALVSIVLRKYLKSVSRSLFLFDTIGVAMYTIAGIEKSLIINLDPVICVAIGIITACFGGVIRDILCRRIPVIFKKEIYATTCMLGGITFFALRQILPGNSVIINITSVMVIIIIRILAVKYKLQLPSLYKEKRKP